MEDELKSCSYIIRTICTNARNIEVSSLMLVELSKKTLTILRNIKFDNYGQFLVREVKCPQLILKKAETLTPTTKFGAEGGI